MAYGQTGSGKTHTMVGENGGTGPCRQPGVLPLVSEELFRCVVGGGRGMSCDATPNTCI